jgi:hypothetical protein
MIVLANMGVPMLFIQMPAMFFALVPVIVIEALFVRSRLALPRREAFATVTAANLLSTIVGIPIAWFIMVVSQLSLETTFRRLATHFHGDLHSPLWRTYEMLTTFAWLDPDEANLYWMVPIASALLLIPSYFASVWLERPVCRSSWRHIAPATVSAVVTRANRLSYAALFLFACVWLGWELLTHV